MLAAISQPYHWKGGEEALNLQRAMVKSYLAQYQGENDDIELALCKITFARRAEVRQAIKQMQRSPTNCVHCAKNFGSVDGLISHYRS